LGPLILLLFFLLSVRPGLLPPPLYPYHIFQRSAYSSTLKMEAVRSSETSVTFTGLHSVAYQKIVLSARCASAISFYLLLTATLVRSNPYKLCRQLGGRLALRAWRVWPDKYKKAWFVCPQPA
jgi:hypothetical protein